MDSAHIPMQNKPPYENNKATRSTQPKKSDSLTSETHRKVRRMLFQMKDSHKPVLRKGRKMLERPDQT